MTVPLYLWTEVPHPDGGGYFLPPHLAADAEFLRRLDPRLSPSQAAAEPAAGQMPPADEPDTETKGTP